MTVEVEVTAEVDKGEILESLYAAISEVSPFAVDLLAKTGQKVDRKTLLVDLGINSIDYAQVAHMVMEQLNINCSLDIFTKTNSISGIVDVLYQLASGEA